MNLSNLFVLLFLFFSGIDAVQDSFTYDEMFSPKTKQANFNDIMRTTDLNSNNLNLTFITAPYITNNKIPTMITGTANEDIKRVKVELFSSANNIFTRVVTKSANVINNGWSFKLPYDLADGDYLIRASAKKNYIYFTFKIKSTVSSLTVDTQVNLNDKNITLMGTVTPGAIVTININDQNAGTINTLYSGNWSIVPNVQLKTGFNKILITSSIGSSQLATHAVLVNIKS